MRWLILAVIGVLAGSTAGLAAETSIGSGVIINAKGEILTNAHVVEACRTITVKLASGNSETSAVFARDERNDLAVVRLTGTNNPPTSIAMFREGLPVRAGDAIVALGYPLSGVLATEANISVGNVSALAGVADDSRYLQISAPVQPGNSGGPLLDASGRLVGIVTAKLNALRVARFTGDIPENVNFALKAEVARTFLDSKGIKYQMAQSDKQMSPADVGDIARPFTVQIECKQEESRSVANITPPTRAPAYSNCPPISPQLTPDNADQLFKEGKVAYAEKKYTEATCLLRQSADWGDIDAMLFLGQMYHTGQGIKQNFPEAMRWLSRAAMSGNAVAANLVGHMYAMGEGTPKDYGSAMHWFLIAANKGNSAGMSNIGELYAKGQSIPKDCDTARQWVEKAIAAGFEDAKRELQSGFNG